MEKNKHAQRTKNNARPSNSSRSAELLGTAVPNFVGFSAVKDGGYVPVLPGLALCTINDIEMNNVDPNFQRVLKKMNKKHDSTTKCKALQEFTIMCQDSDLSAVEGILPFWPRIYCKLTIDLENRVREATQLAHAAVVKRVGKAIGIYLRQLAGAWFTSQYDTYPPAASAAADSFNERFPEEKLLKAIIYCQHQILTYICDNITLHLPVTLSSRKSLTEDEMETKYQKVLIASLQAYSFYLKKIPGEEVEKMMEIHHKIANSNRFWALVKHNALPVKTAFFNALTSMIEYADILLQNEKKRTLIAIMNTLDETEPGLVAAVWESALVAINKIEDWYKIVNIEKLVLPKLWRVLQSGGQCCASIIYPNLLPFVSQFPKFVHHSIEEEKLIPLDGHSLGSKMNLDNVHKNKNTNDKTEKLYINFFSNMRQGFAAKSVQISRSEMFAVTTSFVECLRYSILLNVTNEELCSVLLKEQLMPLLESCMKESTPMKHILFCEVTHLVRYWSKNRENNDYKSYPHLINVFWQELGILFNSLIDTLQDVGEDKIACSSNSQIEFLFTLKNAPVHSRKNLKVQFSNPDNSTIIQCQTSNIEAEKDTIFTSELNNFVNTLCVVYFNKITKQRFKKYIVYLNKLITCFEDAKLFTIVSESLTKEVNFFNFYNEVLRNWLLEKSKETQYIVELIFNLVRYMDDIQKDDVLKSLTALDDIMIRKSVVQCGLSKRNRNDLTVRKWCSQSKVTSLLIDIVKEIASSHYEYYDFEKDRNLILLAFESVDGGELMIKEEGINKIVSVLCSSLHQVKDVSCILHFTQLFSQIVPLTWSHKRSPWVFLQVLETLFELCTQEHFYSNTVFIDTMRDIWKKGLLEAIQRLPFEKFIDLTKHFSTIIWNKIYNLHEEQTKEMLVDVAADFLEIIVHNSMHLKSDCERKIILSFLIDSDIKTWMTEVTGIVLYGEVITGRLFTSTLNQKVQILQDLMSIDLTDDVLIDHTEKCLMWAVSNINLLNNLYLRSHTNVTSSNTQEFTAKQSEKCEVVVIPGMTDILMGIMYSIILGQIYDIHYKSTKCYNNVSNTLKITEDCFKQLQTYLNENECTNIFNNIQMRYLKYNTILSYLLCFYGTALCPNEKLQNLLENCMGSNTTPEIYEIHLQVLQVFSQRIQVNNFHQITADDISALIIARSTLTEQGDNSCYVSILENMIVYGKEDPAALALDCNLWEISWEKLLLPLEVIRLLTELIKKIPSKLTLEQWDFTLLSLVLWQLSINKSKHNANDIKVITFATAISQLYSTLQALIYSQEQKLISDLPPTLLDMWKNVFVTDVQSRILQTWMFYANVYNEKVTYLKSVILLDHLGKAITLLNGNILFKVLPNSSTTVDSDLNETVELCLKLLQSSSVSIQLGAYHVLKHIVPHLAQLDKELLESESFDQSDLNLKRLENVLENTQNIVNTMLKDFKLCDTVSCTIQPYTDSYTYTVGYLLIWAIILDMCAVAHGNLRYQYAEILKSNFFPCLLNNIFRLMPVEVLQDNKNKGSKLVEIFSTAPSLDFGENWSEWRLDHLVCWLYTNCLRHLPVLVRQWWSTADSRVSAAVDKITTHYVSPILCQEEFLNNRLVNIENMQIKVHPTVREVVASYQMDNINLELSIVLPPNHPLGPVTVEPGQHAGGTVNWRNCHMQLSIFLTHQNGSVWDGLALWKRNLDKKFSGVEECCICFSIFHMSTYQIPKLSCHTCRKKFHTPCLYKWFSTSQKSTCPICRNDF